ncbi:post-transcriptional regulator [Ornithinibacillus halotolerans]|nr:post-transcriptional regulator [Ornithinibacillus halotolerans]
MEIVKAVNDWKKELIPVLKSKTEEFQMMGYSKATEEDVWNCLVKKVWKGNPNKRLYEVVQDIFHLSSGIYMSYITIDTYQQDDDLMASIAALTGKS